MNATQVRSAIHSAFAALERAADENGLDASSLCRRAFDAALEGERAHRRMGRGLGGYRQSAGTAARYFVVKWFLDPAKITDARSAASVRLDCLYASALRAELIDRMGPDFADLRAKLEPVAAIDYTAHVVSAA